MTNRNAPPSEVRDEPRERNKRSSGLPEVPDRDSDSTDDISKEKSKMKIQNIGKSSVNWVTLVIIGHEKMRLGLTRRG